MSAPFASVDSALPVIATIRMPILRITGSSATSSSLSPDLPMLTTTSGGLDHADAAVHAVARVEEDGRRPVRGERRRHLLRGDA
jgi:hypothetical protein